MNNTVDQFNFDSIDIGVNIKSEYNKSKKKSTHKKSNKIENKQRVEIKNQESLFDDTSKEEIIEQKEIVEEQPKEVIEQEEIVEDQKEKIVDKKESNTILDKAIKSSIDDIKQRNEEIDFAKKHPYLKRNNILTTAEYTLYHIMLQELNNKLKCINKNVIILSKVRLADIFDVNEYLKGDLSYLYKITNKHIDYLICDGNTLNIICAVELDDKYHEKEDRKQRDEFVNEIFKDTGLRLFRIKELIRFVTLDTIQDIVNFVLDSYTPICPVCGCTMSVKVSKYHANYGHRFYGCNNWLPGGNGCGCTIDID